MEAKPVSHSIVNMTEMVLPAHTNLQNSVFGGTIMSWIDIAAAISAQRHASLPVVTASVDTLHFIAPVYQGWIVNLKAMIHYVGHTSMEIGVHVEAENPIESKIFHTVSAYLTFVALKDGKPCEVPPLDLQTEDEKRRFKEAKIRKAARLELKKEIAQSRMESPCSS